MHNSYANIWLLFIFAATMLAAGVRATAEDWPRYGHDPALTGRSPIRGDVDAPHVAWTCSLAGRELLIELVPAGGEHRLRLSADAAAEPGPREIAPEGPLQLDVDGAWDDQHQV